MLGFNKVTCPICKKEHTVLNLPTVTCSCGNKFQAIRNPDKPKSEIKIVQNKNNNGPGTILSNYLKKFGIATNEGCGSCTHHRDQMNSWGPDECLKRVDTIVRWLRIKAFEQKMPFNQTLAKKFIVFCINKSKKALDAEQKTRSNT